MENDYLNWLNWVTSHSLREALKHSKHSKIKTFKTNRKTIIVTQNFFEYVTILTVILQFIFDKSTS